MNVHIGAPVRRKEDDKLLTGRGRFSDDISVPGQAYGAVLGSPHAHARILSVDVSKAKSAPAVFIGAVTDALKDYGVQHIEMPATPEKVWQAIHGARKGD